MLDVKVFNRERIISKVKHFPKKYRKVGGKISRGFFKESFTLQKFLDLKADTEFKLQIPDSKSLERFYRGFVHLCVNGKTNPVPKCSGFVTNPQKSPLV